MNRLEKVLYTAKAHTTGGRSGVSRSGTGPSGLAAGGGASSQVMRLPQPGG